MGAQNGVTHDGRGQSEVLGFVLLFGLVAMGSVAILLAAGATTDGIESQAEIDRVEGAFVQLSTDLATAASSADAGARTELNVKASEGTIRKVDGGNMTVSIEGKGEVANESLGAIEYTNDDGSVVAYEGGGVWRGTGDRSMPVSGPPITYRGGEDGGTLTLPVFNVSGGSASGSAVAVSGVNTTSNHSGLTGEVDESQNLKINVTTAYHNGWAEYFRSMGDTSVATHGTGEYRTIEVIVGISELPQEIENVNLDLDRNSVISATGGAVSTSTASNSETNGDIVSPGDVTVNHPVHGSVIAGGNVDVNNNGEISGDVIAGGNVDVHNQGHVAGDIHAHTDAYADELPEHEPIDDTYEAILDRGEGEELGDLDGSGSLEAGQYFVDSIDANGLELDVSEGDIDIVVRPGGNVDLGGGVEVTGSDNVVRVLTSGEVSMSGGSVVNAQGQADRFQIFGTTGSSFSFSGGGSFYGSIYAPQDEISADALDASGSLDFYGTFVVGGVDSSGTVTFNGDSSSGPTSPTGNWDGHMDNIETDEPTVYVHVRTHEVVLED